MADKLQASVKVADDFCTIEESAHGSGADGHTAPVPHVKVEKKVNPVKMLVVFCVLLLSSLIFFSVYYFIKLNHKEQELEELRNTIYNLTSNSGDLLEVQTTPQSQCERNNSNLQEILDNVKSESERNYTELQKRLDDCSLNYSEFQKSHDMLKSECDTNYSNLQERLVKVNSEYATNYSDLQSQCTTLNEKHDEVSKEFSDLKEFYCDTKNMSPENTCSVCKMGWVFFSSKCYFFSPNRKTWNNSHDWCLTKGGRLTIIESLEERDFIKYNLVGGSPLLYWIGLSYVTKENTITRIGFGFEIGVSFKGERKPCCPSIKQEKSNIYKNDCDDSFYWICESAPFLLRI